MESKLESATRQRVSATDSPSAVLQDRSRRILLVACFYPPRRPLGGGTIVCSDLSKELSNSDDVEVLAGGINDPPVCSTYELGEERFEGVTVHRIMLEYANFDRLTAQYWNPIVNARFGHLLDRLTPDIVHFHSIQGLGAGLLVYAAKRGIPTVVTLHDSWWLCARQFFLLWDGRTICSGASPLKCVLCITRGRGAASVISRLTKPLVDAMFAASTLVRFFLLRRILALATLVICPSNYLRGTYLRYGFNPTVSRNGIRSGLLKPKIRVPRSRIIFGFAGGTSLEKGFGVVIEAASRLGRHWFPKNIQVRIWGNADPRGQMLMTKCGLGNIEFLGEFDRNQSIRLLDDIDVLLFPSLLPENYPLTVLEGLGSGIPVIASRIGGVHELVQEGVNGFLVSPGNSMELAESMIRFARDPKLVTTMSRNALSEPVRTAEQQASETRALYEPLRSSSPNITLSTGFNFMLATSLFWIQSGLFGIVKAGRERAAAICRMRRLDRLDPALQTAMTWQLSTNRICKRVHCRIGCAIREVRVFCDNLDGRPHTLAVSLHWALNEAPFATRRMEVPARSRASWRSVSVDTPCERDMLYVAIQSDSDRFGRVGYDLEEPYDQLYAAGNGVWQPQKARLRAKVVTTAGVFGVDVTEQAPLPTKPSFPQDLAFHLTALPVLLISYMIGRLAVPTLTHMIAWKKRLVKKGDAIS